MVTEWSVLMLAAAVVALALAGALAAAAWGGRRDGLRTWALALAMQAVACALLGWRAHLAALLVTVGGAVLASAVMACVLAAIARQQEQPLPWSAMLLPPVLLGLALVPLHGDLGVAATLTGAMLAGQCAWVLWTLLERRLALPERGAVLVAVGLGGLMAVHSSLAVAGLAGLPDPQSLLADPAVLTLGALLALVSWLVATVGFVFMHGHRGGRSRQVLAALDESTGIANRRSIIAALDRDVARAIRTRLPIAVLMLEPDSLRTEGDPVAQDSDPLLCGMVDLVQNRIRSQDIVGRYGATELLVVLPDTTAQGAARLAEQLREAAQGLQGLEYAAAGPVTVSVGVFGGRLEPGDNWDQLIHAADHALERARQAGGNRVETTAVLGRLAQSGVLTSSYETYPASLH